MQPKHWTTGIKVKNGTNHYNCRYFCECGNRGKRYIPLSTEFVECHKCGYHIDVEPAGRLDKDGIPQRNRQGNFFIATARH